MRLVLLAALPCLLMAQAPPLTYDQVLKAAATSPEILRTERELHQVRRDLAESSGFLREGPSLSFATGTRKASGLPSSTDQSAEVDLPLFLSPSSRRALLQSLGQADPILREAGRCEAALSLRRAYLDAWLAERLLQLKREDQGLVETWLKAARARCDAGMDPPFQASLVEGEIAKSRLELMEAETRRAETWSRLRSVATLPQSPTSLADPGVPKLPSSEGLLARFEAGSMRKSIQSRMELETSALRHKEALGLSRWSLRGSYSKEGEERIAKLGFAYRFARPGETQAVRRETESGIRNLRKDLEIAMNDLDARFHIAFERLRTVGPFDEPRSYAAAIQAVGLRLEAGKERPSEALPIRRQLLEAQVAELRRQHALHLLQAELEALTEGGTR